MTSGTGDADYGPEQIHPLRAPEVERNASGPGWWSRWALRLRDDPKQTELDALSERLSFPDGAVSLRRLRERVVRLDLSLPFHPLDVDAFGLVDAVLVGIDDAAGIAEINDSPRDWWRTFLHAKPTSE